jgi:hypothetical protein
MITMLLGACILAAALFLGFKLERLAKAQETTADRLFWYGEHVQHAQRAFHQLAEKVDHVAEHFSYPSIAEPVPLPSVDEDDTKAGKPKRKRR